jgi:hypothetical protein
MSETKAQAHKWLLGGLFALLASCSQANPTPNQDEANPETTVLQGAALENLQSVGADGTFEFAKPRLNGLSAQSTALAPYRTGQILVSGISNKTPQGIAPVEITAVEETSSGYRVKTRSVPLEKAIKNANVNFEKVLGEDQLEQLPQGMSLAAQGVLGDACMKKGTGGFVVHFDRAMSLEPRNTNEAITATGRLKGCIRLNVTFKSNVEISFFSLKSFEMGVGTATEQEKSLEIEGSVGTGSNLEVALKTLTFKHQTFLIAGVPVVYQPILTLKLGMDNSVKGAVSAGLSLQRESYLGVRYSRSEGKFRLLSTSSKQVNFLPPQVSDLIVGEVGGSLALEFKLKFYGSLSAAVEAKLRAYANLKPLVNWAKPVTVGINLETKASVEAEINIWGYSLLKQKASFSFSPYEFWKREY